VTIAPQGSANSTLVTGLSGSLIHVDSSPDIVICIPAFNEEATIGDIVSRSKTYGTQIVVCDHGSADDTASEASKNGATVTTHLRNIGGSKDPSANGIKIPSRHYCDIGQWRAA